MRFRQEYAWIWAMFFGIPLGGYLGWGLGGGLLYLFCCVLLRQYVRTKMIFNPDKTLVLETISVSHYVERVRWSLDLFGEKFTEEDNVGILGALLDFRFVPVLITNEFRIADSKNILRYLYARSVVKKNLATDTDVKVDEVLDEVLYYQPTKEALDMEKKIDKVGDWFRRYLYYDIFFKSPLGNEVLLRAWGYYQPHIPLWQRLILRVFAPFFKLTLSQLLKINEKRAHADLNKAKKVLDDIDALLSDGREYLLKTPQITFIDTTFASLAGIMAIPPLWTGGRLAEKSQPKLDWFSEDARKEILAFRRRLSGKFTLKMYENHRGIRTWEQAAQGI
ncbi:hypothetical protein AAMO2058_001295000 [Amorphochlora amoebiformis]|uniref:GST N-terminal domain-containing protein n=1 Tax=Amorphochlora amoebiformis TaxID=1561963 RepID=A0A7S0DCL0_9EUKA|mmetsp:Transcript_22505/g.35322  ORF Transcript_22505/g.35322 Transcript_22505/m.35322 type:complete len:335 (+) Transcript_22505:151-1155(+)